MKPTRSIVALLTALLVALAPLNTAWADLTIQKEKEIGEEAMAEIKAQLPLVDDPDCLAYLRGLGKQMVELIPDSPFTYTFNIVNSPEINAFAVPGGYIFIFRGLMTYMGSEAELASVVAHEIAHVKHRHLAQRIKRSKPVNIATVAGMLAGILLGAAGGAPQMGQAVLMGSVAGGIQKQLAFSREDEEQADFTGYKIITALGYPPQGMREGFHKIWRHESMMGPEVATYLRTHPQSAERMDRIDALIRRHPPRVTRRDNTNFMRIKARLVALYDPKDQAQAQLTGWARKKPQSPWPRYGLALLQMRQRHYQKALAILSRVNPEQRHNPYLLREKALCRLRMGDFSQARDLYSQVLVRLPKDSEALLGIGQVLMNLRDNERAARFFERLVQLEPTNDQARHQLGVALGRLGRTGEASFHLGMSFKLRGNYRAATYHLGRAQGAPDLAPGLRAEAQKALKAIKVQKKKEAKRRMEQE